MSHWLFILIAYAITLAATAALGGWSYVGMRRAEGEAQRLKAISSQAESPDDSEIAVKGGWARARFNQTGNETRR